MAAYYKINNVDILPYIEDEGLAIEENDIDSEDTGRTLDTLMQRAVRGRKDKHSITCRKLTPEQARIVWNAIGNSEFVTVEMNFHPKFSGTVIKTMYNSSRTAAVWSMDRDTGVYLWSNISFNLIER